MKKINVLLVEDQAMVLGALAALLDIEPDIHVCARASNGHEALVAMAIHRPDVLVTDIEMQGMGGLELAAETRTKFPETKVIILTTFARPGYFRRALEAGANGYLLKDQPSAELSEAVRRVHSGLRVIDPELAAEAWAFDADPLSERERQILLRASQGKSTGEIAIELHLSEGTVRNYFSESISKTGGSNRLDAARIAQLKGWL